eukprot:PhM_4_TR3781/c0_g1_i1/m.105206/K15100/SLC25A1, CTP; solute carrier family 25 (mitochondrial citrate transporter), member 1
MCASRHFIAICMISLLLGLTFGALQSDWTTSLGAQIMGILAAGGLAGFMEVTLMYPMENVKTQLQLQDPLYPKFDGMVDCIVKTVKTYGFVGLYGGLTPLLISSVPSHSLRWVLYEYFCSSLDDPACSHSVFNVLVSGLVSGIIVALLIGVPSESIKTRLIDEGERLVPVEGWMGVLHSAYRGVLPTVLKKVVNQGCRFPIYHLAFKAFTTIGADPAQEPVAGFMAGLIAGFASVVLTQPFDVVKTKMQGIHADRFQSSSACAQQLYQMHGAKAFYAGAAPRFVRVSVGAGITFSLYPVLKAWMRL